VSKYDAYQDTREKGNKDKPNPSQMYTDKPTLETNRPYFIFHVKIFEKLRQPREMTGQVAYTDEDIETILHRCIEDVNEFYTFYKNTDRGISVSTIIHNVYENDFTTDPHTKQMLRYIDPQKSYYPKVYIRLYQPTGHWYIGHTQRISARQRHLDEIEGMLKRRFTNAIDKSSKVLRFYNDIFDDEYDDENFVIYTIATVRDITTAKTIEDKLIKHYTHECNETSLPLELCLNTYLVSKCLS